MSADLLLILHDDSSTSGTTLEWCQKRQLKPQIQVASRIAYGAKGLISLPAIIFGGDMQVWEEQTHPWLKNEKQLIAMRLGLNIPNFGLCLGAELLAEQLGAKVTSRGQWQIGWYPVTHAEPVTPLHWHSSQFSLPPDATQIATDAQAIHQGFALNARQMGFQFHAEIDSVRLAHVCRNWKPTLHGLVQRKEAIEEEGIKRMPALKTWYFQQLDQWRKSWPQP